MNFTIAYNQDTESYEFKGSVPHAELSLVRFGAREVGLLEDLTRVGARASDQLLALELVFRRHEEQNPRTAAPVQPLYPWAPCNPGCDPELGGRRSEYCVQICENAKRARAHQLSKE